MLRHFGEFGKEWVMLMQSVSLLKRKPIFLLPLVLCWVVVAGVMLYTRYVWQVPSDPLEGLPMAYLYVFLITFALCAADIVMLELIQQCESGRPLSLAKALGEAVSRDLLKMIPIAAVWALLWLALLVLKAMTRKKRNAQRTPSWRDAAYTLGGGTGAASSRWWRLWGVNVDLAVKLLRMTAFLTLPAIAWEDRGPLQAVKTGYTVIKTHARQFFTTYTLTLLLSLFMALPLIPIWLLDQTGTPIPDVVWMLVILYETVVWTLGMYLEQMLLALLYLWHLEWVKQGAVGALTRVTPPSLLDDAYALKPAETG